MVTVTRILRSFLLLGWGGRGVGRGLLLLVHSHTPSLTVIPTFTVTSRFTVVHRQFGRVPFFWLVLALSPNIIIIIISDGSVSILLVLTRYISPLLSCAEPGPEHPSTTTKTPACNNNKTKQNSSKQQNNNNILSGPISSHRIG